MDKKQLIGKLEYEFNGFDSVWQYVHECAIKNKEEIKRKHILNKIDNYFSQGFRIDGENIEIDTKDGIQAIITSAKIVAEKELQGRGDVTLVERKDFPLLMAKLKQVVGE